MVQQPPLAGVCGYYHYIFPLKAFTARLEEQPLISESTLSPCLFDTLLSRDYYCLHVSELFPLRRPDQEKMCHGMIGESVTVLLQRSSKPQNQDRKQNLHVKKSSRLRVRYVCLCLHNAAVTVFGKQIRDSASTVKKYVKRMCGGFCLPDRLS